MHPFPTPWKKGVGKECIENKWVEKITVDIFQRAELDLIQEPLGVIVAECCSKIGSI